MKLCLLFVLLVCCAIPRSVAQTHPMSPGFRQAEAAQAQAEKSIPPPVQIRHRRDPQKLERAAGELANLAQSIPPQIEQRTSPKDLNNKLKRIEKLAKELQNELSP